jgi:hypothetical protein
MLTRILLFLCVLSALVLFGCSQTEPASNTAANTAKPANTSTSTTNTASTNTASTTTASSGEKIGVPECDEYITKYDACISGKVPEAARAQYKSSIEGMRQSWAKLAANPQTKAGLAAACKQATESAKTSMKSFGCEF